MRNMFTAVLTAAFASTALGAANFINGNWYSNAVDSLVFTNWGTPGTYQEVTNMSDGQCSKTTVSYGGGMAPLDKEVSLHFRGPMHLKAFAFYAPSVSSLNPTRKPAPHRRRHAHRHIHQNRGVGEWVTATIDGQVVSWVNQYAGPPTPTPATSSSTTATGQASTVSPEASSKFVVSSTTPSVTLPTLIAGAGAWGRQAYYNSTSGTADGLVFLNNHGGSGSGVFDYQQGMSLSYASQNSQAGAASPQILADTLLEDQVEVIIYTDKKCEGNDCGTYRPGSVAYHGFDGDFKLFLMEFDMPHSNLGGIYADMPAVWILNAAIPRTQQYGSCSCWPQCGEWDIFEILDSGGSKAKTTLHADVSGGPDQYFVRPVNKTMKAAVVFDGSSSSGYILVLPDDTSFDTTLTDDAVVNFGGIHGIANDVSAKFVLGS